MDEAPPTCSKCSSSNVAEQPGGVFPGLFLCQEKGCDGMHLSDEGAQRFDEALADAWVKNTMHVTGNN